MRTTEYLDLEGGERTKEERRGEEKERKGEKRGKKKKGRKGRKGIKGRKERKKKSLNLVGVKIYNNSSFFLFLCESFGRDQKDLSFLISSLKKKHFNLSLHHYSKTCGRLTHIVMKENTMS